MEGAFAAMAGGYDLGGFKAYSHAQLQWKKNADAFDWCMNWQENLAQGENNAGFSVWFEKKTEGQMIPFVKTLNLQLAHFGEMGIFWSQIRAVDGDALIGTEFKFMGSKNTVEVGATWKNQAHIEDKKKVFGFLGAPLHLRWAVNMKLADGVVWDQLHCLGAKF